MIESARDVEGRVAHEAMLASDNFITKDSGQRQEFVSGMVRDTTSGKLGWHKVFDGPMLRRWVSLLTRGAVKYPDDPDGTANWLKANGEAEYNRFRQSAFRHFMQWYNGDVDEDHAAAVFFNVNGAEYVFQIKSDPMEEVRKELNAVASRI